MINQLTFSLKCHKTASTLKVLSLKKTIYGLYLAVCRVNCCEVQQIISPL